MVPRGTSRGPGRTTGRLGVEGKEGEGREGEGRGRERGEGKGWDGTGGWGTGVGTGEDETGEGGTVRSEGPISTGNA